MPTVGVSDVEISDHRRAPLDPDEVVVSLMNKRVEAFEVADAEKLVSCDTTHAFGKAANDAFYGHFPLRIRPDDVWFRIAQGFAQHVNQHHEALRERFVSHEGKKVLTIFRPDFHLGSDNPWLEKEDGSLEWSRYLMRWRERLRRATTRERLHFMDEPEGPPIGSLHQSLASAPVTYERIDTGEVWALRFVVGQMGVTQDDDGTIAPAFGWAVVYDEDEPIRGR